MSDNTRVLVEGLYDPAFLPQQLTLNDLVEVVSTPVIPTNKIDSVSTKTMTSAEAQQAADRVQKLITDIGSARQELASLRDTNMALTVVNGEPQVSVNTKNRPALKKAIQKVFGMRKNEITYAMYREALNALRQLETEDATNYVEGE